MSGYRLTLIVSLIFMVSACGGEIKVYGTGEPYLPELRQFTVVDSYGTHSDFDPDIPLRVSPYIYFGAFDIQWDVYSFFDYEINFRINTLPSIYGSQLIAADDCSYYTDCYWDQQLYCQYQLDFDVVCESPSSSDIHVSNISHLISTIPQTVYFILEVCNDYAYCEYQAIPVIMD